MTVVVAPAAGGVTAARAGRRGQVEGAGKVVVNLRGDVPREVGNEEAALGQIPRVPRPAAALVVRVTVLLLTAPLLLLMVLMLLQLHLVTVLHLVFDVMTARWR